VVGWAGVVRARCCVDLCGCGGGWRYGLGFVRMGWCVVACFGVSRRVCRGLGVSWGLGVGGLARVGRAWGALVGGA